MALDLTTSPVRHHPGGLASPVTDSGLGSSSTYEDIITVATSTDIDDDILNIVQACQDPTSHMKNAATDPMQPTTDGQQRTDYLSDVVCAMSSARGDASNKTTTATTSKLGKSSVYATALPRVASIHAVDAHGAVYGATHAAYGGSRWTQQGREPPPKANANCAPTLYAVDFAAQVKALKHSLKGLEKEGSIVSLVNAVSMVRSIERCNWKSVMRLLDKNTDARNEFMNMYISNPKKRQPIMGNVLAPMLKRHSPRSVNGIEEPDGSHLRVDGNQCTDSLNGPLRGSKSVAETIIARCGRPYGGKTTLKTPGEIALIEGRKANKLNTLSRSVNNKNVKRGGHRGASQQRQPYACKSAPDALGESGQHLPVIHTTNCKLSSFSISAERDRKHEPKHENVYRLSDNYCCSSLQVPRLAGENLDLVGTHLPNISRSLQTSGKTITAYLRDSSPLSSACDNAVESRTQGCRVPRASVSSIDSVDAKSLRYSLDSDSDCRLIEEPVRSGKQSVHVPSFLVDRYHSSLAPDAPPATPASPCPDAYVSSSGSFGVHYEVNSSSGMVGGGGFREIREDERVGIACDSDDDDDDDDDSDLSSVSHADLELSNHLNLN